MKVYYIGRSPTSISKELVAQGDMTLRYDCNSEDADNEAVLFVPEVGSTTTDYAIHLSVNEMVAILKARNTCYTGKAKVQK